MGKKYGPRYSSIYTGGKKTSGLPFQGELMTCVMCDKQQQSDPAVESGWTRVEADGVGYYVCPAELPGASGTKQQFADAYDRILGKIIERRRGGA
jgi:hypothetical protein